MPSKEREKKPRASETASGSHSPNVQTNGLNQPRAQGTSISSNQTHFPSSVPYGEISDDQSQKRTNIHESSGKERAYFPEQYELQQGIDSLTTGDKIELEGWVSQAEKLAAERRKQEGADYYAMLNLPRNASDDEIRESYRKFSRMFHPDKHIDSETQQWASAQFQEIQKAYEVLINPTQRAAYDTLGEKGVTTNLEVGSKLMSKQELRQEFERNIRLQREKELSSLIGSKSEITLGVNAALLASTELRNILYERGVRVKPIRSLKDMYSHTQRQQFVAKHSFMVPFGTYMNAFITASAVINGKKSVGSAGVKLTRSSGPGTTTEVSFPFLSPYSMTVKRSVQISSGSFYNFQTKLHSIDLSTPPSISGTYGQALKNNLTGFLTFNTGNQYHIGEFWNQAGAQESEDSNHQPNQATGQDNKKPKRIMPKEYNGVTFGLAGVYMGDVQFNTNVTFSEPQQQLALVATKQVDSTFSINGGITFVIASQVIQERKDLFDYELPRENGLGAVVMHLGGEMNVTEYEKYGYRVDFGLNSGTSLQLSYGRLGQNIKIPILLSPVFEFEVLAFSLLVPTTIALGVNYLVVRPRKLLKLRQRISDLENEFKQDLELQKRRSNKTKKLLEAASKQKRLAETKANGLVIERALYGDVSDLANSYKNSQLLPNEQQVVFDDTKAIDVSGILMALVNNSQLVVPVPKNGLQGIIGFYNPLAVNAITDSASFAKEYHFNTQDSGSDSEFFSSRRIKNFVSHLGLVFDSLPTKLAFMDDGDNQKNGSLLEQVSRVKPQLFIEYSFKGKQHVAVLDDGSSIILPLEAHLVDFLI